MARSSRRQAWRDPLKGPTTTERGMGWDHQQQRQHLLRTTPEGFPCPVCLLPMHPRTNPGSLDADHSVPRSLGGTRADRLTHRSCNRARGNGVTTGLGTGRRTRPPAQRTEPTQVEGYAVAPVVRTREW